MVDSITNAAFRSKRNRIFIGLIEIANIGATYAKAFQALGYRTYTVVQEKNPYFTYEKYDVVIAEKIGLFHGSLLDRFLSLVFRQLLLIIEFIKALYCCDIFIFIYGSSFFPESYIDYPILKLAGKKIVTVFCGCDIRHWSAYEQEFESLKLGVLYKSCCEECDLRSLCYLNRKIRIAKVNEKYSNLILSQRNQSQILRRPYMRFNIPLVLLKYQFNVPARDVPLVVHAPTNRSVKGTEQIVEAVKKLRREGIDFEFRLIENCSNRELLKILTDSDIVVDQLYAQTIATLALESLATGNAVLVGSMPDYELIPGDCPAVFINYNTLYDELKGVILDKERRISMSKAGRKYVETYHDHIVVVKQILNWLEPGGIQKYDYYPDFAEKHYRMPDDVLKKERFYLLKDMIRFLRQ